MSLLSLLSYLKRLRRPHACQHCDISCEVTVNYLHDHLVSMILADEFCAAMRLSNPEVFYRVLGPALAKTIDTVEFARRGMTAERN